jgi:phosphatidylinositol alpha 1,6-mannosyltransferase
VDGGGVRVAVVTESFLPTTSGVTTSVLRVLDHLAERGDEAVVVCPGPAPARYRGFRVHEVPALRCRGFPLGLPHSQLAAVLERADPDVVHVASPWLLGAQALHVARGSGVPSVAVYQTDLAGYARRHALSAAAPAVWAWLRRVHALADVTLAPSRPALADLRAHGVPRTALWPRGVDATAFGPRHRATPAGQALRDRLAGDGRLLVGYVGRLAREKRVQRLAALRDLPGVRLVVAGDGPDRPAVSRALGPGAAMLGHLGGEALATAYAALDVFVHTGTEETFGQAVQEAMASGVAVVAPARGGLLDVVDDGKTGLLYPPEDDAAMRALVGGLAADPGRRARLAESARRAVLPRSWRLRGEELVGWYSWVQRPRPEAAPWRDGTPAGAVARPGGPLEGTSPATGQPATPA